MHFLLRSFAEFALNEGFLDGAYLVGGAVRDLILRKALKDVDVVIGGDTTVTGKEFAEEIGGSFVPLDTTYGIVRIVKDGKFLDLCAMKGGSIDADLADRDITVNAMALPLSRLGSEEPGLRGDRVGVAHVIDPFGGVNDLGLGIIRMVSEENLVKDPLRLLRVYRFSATLGFMVEINTSVAVRKHAAFITTVAEERVAEELRYLLKVPHSYKTVRETERDGLLFHIFPEIRHLEPAAWSHTLRSYRYVEHILSNLVLYLSDHADHAGRYFAMEHRVICLKLAALLISAAGEAAARLKMSHRETELIQTILAHQHRLSPAIGSNKTAVIRLLDELRDNVYALLVFAIARALICQCTEHPLLSLSRGLLTVYHHEFIPRSARPPLVTGHDLVNLFHLEPSPVFKRILGTVREMALEGTLQTREEALKAVRQILRESRL